MMNPRAFCDIGGALLATPEKSPARGEDLRQRPLELLDFGIISGRRKQRPSDG
jgi:hypothetical protein